MNSRIDRFVIDEKLPSSGMSEVFRAHIHGPFSFKKRVVLKKVESQNDERTKALIREASTLSKLSHPNIVFVYEFFEHESDFYLVLEDIQGQDLFSLLSNQKLSFQGSLFILYEVLKALEYIHSAKIIHRDMTPSNILISRLGEVKISDFGLSRHASHKTTLLRGTSFYLAPEQVNNGAIGYSTDLFCLGLVVFEMLYQNKFFDGSSDIDVMEKIRNYKVNSDFFEVGEFREMFCRVLHQDPSMRFQSAQEWREYIKKHFNICPTEEFLSEIQFKQKAPRTCVIQNAERSLRHDIEKTCHPEAACHVEALAKTGHPEGSPRRIDISSPQSLFNKIKRISTLRFHLRVTKIIASLLVLCSLGVLFVFYFFPSHKPHEIGYLSVRTTPWTNINIQGKKFESPLYKLRLPEGEYEMLLINPVKNIHESMKILIQSERNTIIVKNF
ncbi:MAG: serine/threonine protein kinase [Deltaproteobacteria bacterium]|nr:serine/threonine protein kinase [Deltaproteobacteria bacterium]